MSNRYGYNPAEAAKGEDYTPAQKEFYKKALEFAKKKFGNMGYGDSDPTNPAAEYALNCLNYFILMNRPDKNYFVKDEKGQVTAITTNGYKELMLRAQWNRVDDFPKEILLGLKKKELDAMLTKASEEWVKKEADDFKFFHKRALDALRENAKLGGVDLDDPKVFKRVIGLTYQEFGDRILGRMRDKAAVEAHEGIERAIENSEKKKTLGAMVGRVLSQGDAPAEKGISGLVKAFENAGKVVIIDAYLGKPSSTLEGVLGTPRSKLDEMREEFRVIGEYHQSKNVRLGHTCYYEQLIPPDYAQPKGADLQRAKKHKFDSFDKLADFETGLDVRLPPRQRLPGALEQAVHFLGGPAPSN